MTRLLLTLARTMLWRASLNYGGLQEEDAPLPASSDLMQRLHDECVQILINEPAK